MDGFETSLHSREESGRARARRRLASALLTSGTGALVGAVVATPVSRSWKRAAGVGGSETLR